LFAPVIIRMPRASLPTVISLWLSGLLAVSVAQMIWTERKRKKIREMTARLEPQKLPDFTGQQEQKGWLLCYQPSVPTLVMKGPHGYALNLAHRLTQLGAAYLAGYVVLVVAPRFMGH
jgi:hypothetical protein